MYNYLTISNNINSFIFLTNLLSYSWGVGLFKIMCLRYEIHDAVISSDVDFTFDVK